MDGTQFRGLPVAVSKLVTLGLYADPLSDRGGPQDNCEFTVTTGTTGIPDVTFSAGIQALLPAAQVPKGCRCYITSVQVTPTTVFAGGTAGTVSLTIEGTDGADIATFTQTALSVAGVFVSLPMGTPPTGVTDVSSGLANMAANTAIGVGIQALKANSTSGVARVRIRGYFAP